MSLSKEVLFCYFPKYSFPRYQNLIKIFSSLEKAWNATFEDLQNAHFDQETALAFIRWREELSEPEICAELEREEIECVTREHKNYPFLLKQIHDPPLCLFVRGKLPKNEFCVSVVGTRKASLYGRQVTESIVSSLAQSGVTIVSGLAIGIDCIAHESTLAANGDTIAVLGGGIDKKSVAPTANQRLAERIIAAGGGVVSEYPPGRQPTRYTFPARNRIIAGMSLGTLVVEAGESSGSLITAASALESNREVFAIPHNITSPQGIGTNTLIQNGGRLVMSAADILQVLNLTEVRNFVQNGQILPDSPLEATILEHLTREPTHIDELIKKTKLPSQTVGSQLTYMEMKGKIKNLGGMTYTLNW